MGAGASVTVDDMKSLPQWKILEEADVKLPDEEKVIPKILAGAPFRDFDPYLKYGGDYLGSPLDSKDFKYLTFTELPKVLIFF